ncbi:calcium/calmodulin-dependent 3',5'-cyclic nucleotide phosphodiesterase 1C isoform X2 [Tetranychus urticae]|uniref:calcium/calmodulin-dependent 3',5'-cyclic nucleotide phosphodiesterase 1C isoform X2 n=1 Tax=Tetranychus urticae TaxID=32264 RepID=UPI00077BEF92|nr:calcium/calmodulin-dependent 3',5'-cyclic nucleotide phosphodiesterase 1C isoform X2 [Tetranychus urticae]
MDKVGREEEDEQEGEKNRVSVRLNNNEREKQLKKESSSLSVETSKSLFSPLSSASTLGESSLLVEPSMGRKNCKPEEVTCLTQNQATSSQASEDVASEKSDKVSFQSSSCSSPSTSTKPVNPCFPHHPHHYHHHRHYPNRGSPLTKSGYWLDNNNNMVYGKAESVAESIKRTSLEENLAKNLNVYSNKGEMNISLSTRRLNENPNPLGLPDGNRLYSSKDKTRNDGKSDFNVLTNPLPKATSTATTMIHSSGSSSLTPSHSHSKYHHYCCCSSSSSSSSPSSSHRTHLPSPRKSKKISSRNWLHRSSSDPTMASSATYSTHTSALLLTTGAYSGSPNILSSKTITLSSSSSSTPTTTTAKTKASLCCSSVKPKPVNKSPLHLSLVEPSSSSSPSPTSLNLVPSTSPIPSTPTCLTETRHLTSSPADSLPNHIDRQPDNPSNQPQPTTTSTLTKPLTSKNSTSPSTSPQPVTCSSSTAASSASQFFSSQMSNTKRCVLRLDGYSYLIVANPPETKVTKDAHHEQNRPQETTIVARRTVQKTTSDQWTLKDTERATDKIGDSLSLKETSMDTLPPVDTVEACDKAASRLRELAQHLDHGEVPISILKKTLQYAACVLDTVTMDETRKLLDEEDDLSEVQPDAVPNEVREWLASTFTRNNTAQKRRSEEKPKFRSVANAIRAGIMVDRLYRRLCCSNMVQIPPKIADKLKSIDNWSYECFKLNEASNNQVLKYISYELLNRYGLVHKFKIPLETLESCLNQFEQGYTKFKNPYHNNIHAADVTQTVHYMLSKMGLVNWLTDLEIFATLLAAIIHDFQHTGTTNNFHVMSESETALLYNDRAVLENFHVSAAFRILKESDCNILVNLNKEEYRELRTLVIDMVLATDMSSHFQQIKTMKSLLTNSNEFTVDKSKALSLVLHCCDISHPSKQWDIHRKWTELLLEEFFRQGDKERELGLPYSPLCDRNTTLVAESQIGFIDFIVAPSLEVCGDLLDKIYQQMEGCRHSSGSSEESLEERLPDSASRPKSLSTYKNKRSGLSIDSADASLNSRPVASAPASPRFSHCSSFGNCKIEGGRLKRPWAENLDDNRKRWQERAAIDAIQRERNARKQATDGISLSMSPESEL